MPIKTRDVKKALTSKGFKENEKRDHCFYFLLHEGKKTAIFTKISHGEKEINDSLCGRMARQIRLSADQFRELVDCSLTEELYVQILIQAKILQPIQAAQKSKSISSQ